MDTIIQFDPPILVRGDVISGGMTVSSAEVIEQTDSSLIVRINGDGRVIGIPFEVDAETSLRTAIGE